MKIFISGATGFIGSRLAIRLANEGHTVHALYRSLNKTEAINHPNIILFKGDILDRSGLDTAVSGCEQVYHTAAFAKVWDRDPSLIYRLNIEGALNVINSGMDAGVRKFVCTSTAGVFGPSGISGFVDEATSRPEKYFIHYESSKSILEGIIKTLAKSGVSIVLVNPTRVYGPGLLSESNGVTRMIKKYSEGKWHLIPGNGKSIGNYVYVEDVVTGHILAMDKGKSGENYILGGENVSYNDFFAELSNQNGSKHFLIHFPLTLMLLLSKLLLGFAMLTGKDPLITPPLVKKFIHHWNVSGRKAITELGYKPISLSSGLKNTLNWINELKLNKNES